MKNERGKSDRPVVPQKSPNNAGQPVTEGMEGRGLAKGNPPQQNAFRTPSRSDAPSALERIRQAAKKDRKLRFTALLHPMHAPIPEVGQWLRSVVSGHLGYYMVPMNTPALQMLRFQTGWLWHHALSRRSQNGRVSRDRMRRFIDRWLPPVRVHYDYPLRRLGVIT